MPGREADRQAVGEVGLAIAVGEGAALHLDDLGPAVGEQSARLRADHDDTEIEDAQVLERCGYRLRTYRRCGAVAILGMGHAHADAVHHHDPVGRVDPAPVGPLDLGQGAADFDVVAAHELGQGEQAGDWYAVGLTLPLERLARLVCEEGGDGGEQVRRLVSGGDLVELWGGERRGLSHPPEHAPPLARREQTDASPTVRAGQDRVLDPLHGTSAMKVPRRAPHGGAAADAEAGVERLHRAIERCEIEMVARPRPKRLVAGGEHQIGALGGGALQGEFTRGRQRRLAADA